jgi:hypothetical protein
MSFYKRDADGMIIRNRQVLDCQKAIEEGEEIRVEQAHKDEVNINNIVKKHGIDLITKTSKLVELKFDDVTGNDFQEFANMMAKASSTFESLDSNTRREFDNDPVKYMDYVHNPENRDKLIERGWMKAPDPGPVPVQVEVVNPPAETPPESSTPVQ